MTNRCEDFDFYLDSELVGVRSETGTGIRWVGGLDPGLQLEDWSGTDGGVGTAIKTGTEAGELGSRGRILRPILEGGGRQ